MPSYRFIIMDDEGCLIDIEQEDALQIVANMAVQTFKDLKTAMRGGLPIDGDTPSTSKHDPWWTFLHSLPEELKLSEHVGAVMEMWEGKTCTPHAKEAFKNELSRRVKQDAAQ